MNIGAVITARSTSHRYPRKHLGILGGKPMIEQIIIKLERLSGLNHIILSTTDNPADDELCKVAAAAGAEINRGPEHNLLERDFLAIDSYNLDIIIPISGDCPFVSNNCCQFLIDTVRDLPNWDDYDSIGGFATFTAAWGFVPGMNTARSYEKYIPLMKKYKDKYSYEQYWLSGKEEPELFKAYTIDTSGFLAPEITPMKMSIDWRLENLIWNVVIDYLGYYPEEIEDFNKAFGGIETL